MVDKFLERSMPENFLRRSRKLIEEVNALKMRDLAGASSQSGGSDAADITYTPAVNADWNSSTDPGDVDGALDQLAERTKDLEAFTGLDSPVSYGFQVGMIMQWAGAIVDIPDGWQLCDGTNGTPNLRDKFVIGAGDTYAVDDTGGAETHDHEYTEVLEHTHPVSITDTGHNHTQNPHTHVQDPHQHGMAEGTTDGSGTFMDRSNAAAATTAVTDNATATNQNTTAVNNSATTGITATTSNPAGSVASGTTDPASSLPPYYALAFIMCMEVGAGVAAHAHKGYQLFLAHGLNGTVPASSTYYLPVGYFGVNATAYSFTILRAGTIKNLSFRLNGAQPSSGSLVITVNKNGVNTALQITLTSSSSIGTHTNTANSFTVAAGDFIVPEAKNNATGASGLIGAVSFEFEYDVE